VKKPMNRQSAASLVDAFQPYVGSVDARLAAVHKNAVVSSHAIVGATGEWRGMPTRFPAHIASSVIVREFARIHAGCERPTVVGEGTLVCSGAYIAHDVHIGEGCDIAPNATICGLVSIGNRVKVGAGSVIRPRITIGDDARIGAGAVVVKDIPAGETWAGNPARRIR